MLGVPLDPRGFTSSEEHGTLALTTGAPGSRGLRLGLLVRAADRLKEGRSGTESHGRDWREVQKLADMVNARSPNSSGIASAAVFLLHNLTLREQAAAVREYDLIITTHGSHSVSLAFIRP